MRNDKISEKVCNMMEYQGSREEIFQRRKQRWLQYGRALLTLGVLGILTIALYSMTHTNSTKKVNDEELTNARIIVEESNDIAISNNSEEFSEKIIAKRAASDDKIPKSQERSLNDVESDNELDMDSQHLKIFRRQQSSSNNAHRHSDNGVYIFKGYKCVPIRCNCHVSGSEDRVCDHKTGQCKCRQHVNGRTCDQCESGYWNLDSKRGCEKCECNLDGSEHESCDIHSGECVCKPGVEGAKCDSCKSGFYGFSLNGCKKCNPCDTPAKVCDQETGRCVCPPFSHGSECEHCHPNTWGWEYLRGCKNCECNQVGSLKQSCDIRTGQCECKEGYTGRACDYCAVGFHGFPKCQPCNCDLRGSKNPQSHDIIDCDDNGQCPCKELVTGLKCDECRQSTFGLSFHNPNGCTRCFCFGRSQTCTQHDSIWGQVRSMGPRNVTVHYLTDYHNNNDVEYVVMSHIRNNQIYRESAFLSNINSLTVIPGTTGDITIGSGRIFRYPLYIELSKEFLGDKTTSYGGFLNFSIATHDARMNLNVDILKTHPLVQMHTHYHLILNYFLVEPLAAANSYSIVLHESYWRHGANGYNISRAIMMTALQNVKHIFVRVTTSSDFLIATIENVTLSIGMSRNGNNNAAIASGVEQCECSEVYSGSSCQNPADGFYRWRNTTTSTNLLEDLVGKVVPCECNDRSEICDKESGECLDCEFNTGGFHCEECAEGFYGHPDNECIACPCPETSRNYASGCFVERNSVSCFCKDGYTGPLCDKCAKGYFGNPDEIDGKCESCDCSIEGIVSDECDYSNGQCNCKRGVTGRRCDKCELPRHLLIDYECQLCDNCTQTLLDTVDKMMYQFEVNLNGFDLHDLKAPWFKLNELSNTTDFYGKQFDEYFESVDGVDNFNDIAGDEMLAKSDGLHSKSNRIQNSIDKKSKKVKQMKLDTEKLLINIRVVIEAVQDTIINLESYGSNEDHVKLPIALNEAQKYFDEISQKAKDLPNSSDINKCGVDYLDYLTHKYEELSTRKMKLDIVLTEIQNLLARLDDLKNLTHRVFRDSSETEAFITKNKKNFDRLKEKTIKINDEFLEIEKLLDTNFIAASSSKMESLHDSFEKAEADNENLMNLQDEVEKIFLEREDELNEIRDKIVPEAQKHAEELSQRSKIIVNLFQTSKDGAQVAINAGTAHKNITDAIHAAKIAANHAHEAAMRSQEALNPVDEETFSEKGEDLSLESIAIQEDAEEQIKKINELKTELNEQQDLIKEMSDTIRKSGKMNNEISQQITRLTNNDGRKAIQEAAVEVDSVLENIRGVAQEVDEINENVDNLKERLKDLDPEWDSKFGLAEENIAKSLINIREGNNLWNINEQSIQQENEKFAMWNDSISSKLQQLRDKITKAKHVAESIKVSLESPDDSCIRSFYPTLIGVTTSNQIVLNFALNSKNINSPLLFLQGDKKEFIALEMINRKVKLLWNFGGDETGSVVHPTEIQTRDPKYDDAWYKIEVTRNLNVGSLSVNRMTNSGNYANSTPVIAATSLNTTRFVITQNSRMYVGGVPDNLRPKDILSANGLSVIVHQLFVDQFQVGLWHFASSEGKCEGAMLGPTETSDSSIARHFNGHGYSVVRSISTRPYPKKLFSLQMTFKTFDENALLLLAVDEKNNRSISLTLHEGKLVFRIDYGGESQLEINTTNRYNTGKWVNVEAAREFTPKRNTENGSLKVNNEEPQTGSPTKPIISAMLPEVSKAPFYVGGTPPGFKSGTTKAPGAENAFFGCMRDIQINGEIFDPLDSQNYYGIEPTCKDVITKAGFYGNGYLELPSHSLRKRANFGFVFRTLQPDCLLLFSGFPPQTLDEYDEKDVRGNFSVSLINGHIHVWITAGKGRVELESNLTLNDGEFHVVNVNKMGRKFELRINDKFEIVRSLSATPALINSPEEFGGLFLGGAPDFPEFDNMAPTFNGLKGGIKDVVFNNKTISFDAAMSFKNAHIGGLGPTMGTNFDQEIKTEPMGPKFRETTEGCQTVGSYSYETNAFKFGQPFSYSMLQVPSQHLWHRNFNIQFGFRTFYPDGFLFVAPDSRDKPKHYVYLYLRDGHLVLVIRGRKRDEITLPTKANNGQWHQVVLDAKNHVVTLTINSNGKNKQENRKIIRIPKKFFGSNLLFIGGLPSNVPKLHKEVISKKENFKGCIRRFSVNGITQDLTKHFYNLGQCFPRIEKGSYFSGDAYAEYKNEFNVGKHLEVEMEFKTSEINGILLSIAESSGTPSLSIILLDGKLVMSCDFNNGEILRAESKLPTKYSLCDNKWHNISALYDTHQIAIRIDEMESVVASGHNNGKLNTKSSVYIGGVSESSHLSRTIFMRENFKGCIRNVKINSGYNGMEIIDWTDMAKLNNVLVNECPLGTR